MIKTSEFIVKLNDKAYISGVKRTNEINEIAVTIYPNIALAFDTELAEYYANKVGGVKKEIYYDEDGNVFC